MARRIGDLALRLRTSRKRVIERAIDMLARSVEDPSQDDTYTRTFWRLEAGRVGGEHGS